MDFDRIIDRTGTHSIKWDYREKLFGEQSIIPLWVADMDFESPPAVKEALKKRAEHGVFGYTAESRKYFEGIINWFEKRHNWSIQKSWLHYLPGVIPGLNWVVQTFSGPGDKVIIQPPVYKPFFQAIENNDRKVVENPLVLNENAYSMDLEGLEAAIDAQTKMLILCSPHNPVGRVWQKSELEKLGEICLRNNLLLISDEIHFDLVYDKASHWPIASLNQALREQTITFTSPGKTFNLQGLKSAYAIIPNKTLSNAFGQTLQQNGIFLNNAMSITGIEAAYHHGEPWLNELLPYLEDNKAYLKTFCEENLPGISLIEGEGTYLGWLDCRALKMSQDNLKTFMVQKAGLGLNDGMEFGKQGEGFMRINFACPRSRLDEALKRLAKALND